ncbi:MAG TPA: DUF1801 domain-containing protein [Chryseolinea sp.]|nr:DUF1801 domain-containing protein [Chryseolinea sp.]
MAKNKTTQTDNSVTKFIDKVENEVKRDDSFKLIEICKSITGHEPKMWGPSIIGFGSYHYIYASGREGDAPLAGFSPRRDSLVVYIATEFEKRKELLSQLGKHTSSKSCVYVKKLDDISIPILKEMIKNSMDYATKLFPTKVVGEEHQQRRGVSS